MGSCLETAMMALPEWPKHPLRYKLKDSFKLLQQSASRGCECCAFIARSFPNAEAHDGNVWLERTYLDLPRVGISIDDGFEDNSRFQISTTYGEAPQTPPKS